MRMDLVIRFDYGRTVPWVTRQPDGALVAMAGPHLLALRTDVPIRGEGLRTVSEFTLREGQTARFDLAYGSSFLPVPPATDMETSLRKTQEWWSAWISRCTYNGRWADVVKRSLITLKALTYEPTGGIAAAATTSLPEQPRGTRNWDYRFCWLRDATFTFFAFMHAGYSEEARRWRDWLLRSVAGSADQLQVLYGFAGERQLLEWEVPWLTGYEGASPVRVGNAATKQLQLDIFGEIADVLYHTPKQPAPARKKGVSFRSSDLLAGASSENLARGRSRHLGSPRSEKALHPFQGDGLGGIRSRHPRLRASALAAPLDEWRAPASRNS